MPYIFAGISVIVLLIWGYEEYRRVKAKRRVWSYLQLLCLVFAWICAGCSLYLGGL